MGRLCGQVGEKRGDVNVSLCLKMEQSQLKFEKYKSCLQWPQPLTSCVARESESNDCDATSAPAPEVRVDTSHNMCMNVCGGWVYGEWVG